MNEAQTQNEVESQQDEAENQTMDETNTMDVTAEDASNTEDTTSTVEGDETEADDAPKTRIVRVPEKFTQRFLYGHNAEGTKVYAVIGDDSELVKRIIDAEPTPRGNGGFTREVAVTREEYQELYSLMSMAREYMKNVEKEPSADHRANTLSAGVSANAVCTRMEKDTEWGIDNPVTYTPKSTRKSKTEVAPETSEDTDESNDGVDETESGDLDLSSTYERPTLNTADDAEELPEEDQQFINQDVASGNG